ncbi:Choline-sulfatase [Lunatimonas lonarensis]|uniref:Choline-sulfatase n=1 Tax=Lunatimonas lonarensis TaxID=1232681 RepID=R7ZVI6_9BACT|nr:Choline-sulfatase [Lunatimonas lonarensis]
MYALQVAERPNLILIIADDIGWDDLGCYGHPLVQSPNLDRIASEGLVFDHFYLTTSSCSPSRASIISGRYPHNTGAAELHTELPASLATFPAELKAMGYYTAQAGKWHLGPAAKAGFDVVYDKGSEMGDGGEERWLPTLRERPGDKPFFMWFAALDAHRPWGPNPFSGTHNPEEVFPPVYLADAIDTKKDLASYYDEITRFDHYIGEVEKELARQGVLENTLIMIVSDNGRPFPRSKTRMYDSGIKSPLVIKWPAGIPHPGSRVQALVSAIDIAPTMVELAGGSEVAAFQGKSFLSVLKEPNREFRNYVFAEHNWHDHEALERMVRTKEHVYVLNLRPQFSQNGPADSNASDSYRDLLLLRDQGKLNAAQADVFAAPRPYEELYLPDDEEQLHNVAANPAHRQTLLHLRHVMTQWMNETEDTQPDRLTPDWYNKENGKPLDIVRERGEMPGSKGALHTHATGPF